jgi:putative methionine-R-sulfoxide reductase with GAF domain
LKRRGTLSPKPAKTQQRKPTRPLTLSAMRLCEANSAFIFLRDAGVFRVAARQGFSPAFQQWVADHPITPGRGTITGRAALEGRTVHVPDVLADSEHTASEYQSRGGYRTFLAVPLLREGSPIGVISLVRTTVWPFSDKQIELVTTFADQAVIAIENVRLFEEVQARTAELQKSLEYQSATSEVLNVISRSPTNAQPVFDAIVESAARLCEAAFSVVLPDDGRGHHGRERAGSWIDVHDPVAQDCGSPQEHSIETLFAAVHESVVGRFCCKSLQREDQGALGRRSMTFIFAARSLWSGGFDAYLVLDPG